jgi:hypothetical protein
MLAPGLDDGPRRATGAVPIDDLGGGSAKLLHPLWVKGSVGFLGIPAWMVPACGLLQRAICVGSGFAHLRRLPPLPTHDCVNDDPCPEAKNHDARDHLPRDQNPSRLGRRRDITESNRRKHGDGEVQRVSTRHRLAEIASRDGAHDEIGASKQQQKQWNARRKGSDSPQRRIRRPDDRADLKGDQSNKRQKPDCQRSDGHADRNAVQWQQVIDRNQRDRRARRPKESDKYSAKSEAGLVDSVRTRARDCTHRERLNRVTRCSLRHRLTIPANLMFMALVRLAAKLWAAQPGRDVYVQPHGSPSSTAVHEFPISDWVAV